MNEEQIAAMTTYKTETKEKAAENRTGGRYAQIMQRLEVLTEENPFLSAEMPVCAPDGRKLPALFLGEGAKSLLYLHVPKENGGNESALLLQFAEEYARAYRQKKRIFNTYLPHLWREYKIVVLPHFLPRESPDAEPAFGALGNYLRFGGLNVRCVICFREGKGIVRPMGKPYSQPTRLLAAMAGFLAVRTPVEPLPAFPEILSFFVECPVPETASLSAGSDPQTDRLPSPSACFGTYAALRQLLFESPFLF